MGQIFSIVARVVFNVQTNTDNGLSFYNITNSIWNGFTLTLTGNRNDSNPVYLGGQGILFNGTCDNTCKLTNIKVYNNLTGNLYESSGICICGMSTPTIDGFYVVGALHASTGTQCSGITLASAAAIRPIIKNGSCYGGVGGYADGLAQGEDSAALIENVTGYGGTGTSGCNGLSADNGGISDWINVIGYGGNAVNSYANNGIRFWGANNNHCQNIQGYPGYYPSNVGVNAGIICEESSSPIINGVIGSAPRYSQEGWYANANNGRFDTLAGGIFEGDAYVVYSLEVYCIVAHNGV